MPERDGYIAGVPCWVDSPNPIPMRPSGSTALSSAGSSRT